LKNHKKRGTDFVIQNQLFEAERQFLVHTYNRPPIEFVRGEGVYLYDRDGKQYLDFSAGIAVTALGHSDPEWAAAVAEQAHRLTHVSNLFHTAPHVELAKRLVERSFADRVFFSNSGAEANEAALKFARKWAGSQIGEVKKEIIAFEGGFHGRTYGSLSLTAKEKYRRPFAPLIPGVKFLPFNDLESARCNIGPQTCAVFVEPVQGEGGVRPATMDFLTGLRQLCDEHDVLLVCDEVQCGLGRTGWLWAHEAYGVTPDIMTLAKPLAGGLPIGATLVTEEIARCIEPGDHGSTFAAGPLVCHAAQVVFDRIAQIDFLHAVAEHGEKLMRGLVEINDDQVIEVRGMGLLVGVELRCSVLPLIEAALERGMVVINAGENVLRLCPPLVITETEIETGLQILAECLANGNLGE
jgi:predicted acetylornithine/succinylornithine family transaminase